MTSKRKWSRRLPRSNEKMDTLKAKIRSFLSEHSDSESVDQISDVASLLDAGVLDSLMMVDLVAYLESEFEIVIDDDDMVPEYFDSVASITRYVERKRQSDVG